MYMAAAVDYCPPITGRYHRPDVKGDTRSCFLVIFILLVAATATAAANVKFTSNHSAAIEVGQSASYHCSVNDTRVAINWFINGSSIIPPDINVTGAATPSSNLTIPGLTQYNNTEVRCLASGILDNNVPYTKFSDSTLKIQGKLPAVTNLFCEQKNLCIECTWARPFSLTQPIHYAINFTTNEENTTTLTTMDTTISHCLCSQYNISVAASNTVGLGNITYYKNVITLMPNYFLMPRDVNSTTNKEGEWNITFAANASCLAGNFEVIATMMTYNDSMMTYNDSMTRHNDSVMTQANGTAAVNGGTLNGTIQTEPLSKAIWNLTLDVRINNNHFIETSEPIVFSTYGIRSTSVTVNNADLCFDVEFVEGSDTEKCFIEYKCSRESANGNVTLRRNETSKCENVRANSYTVTFYDGKELFDEENVVVSSLPLPTTLTSILPTSTESETILTSSLESPSVTNNGKPSNNSTLVVVVPIAFTLGIIMVAIVTLAVIMASLIHKRKCREKVKADEVNTEATIQTQTCELSFSKKQLHTIQYCETEVSTDRPRAPPPMEEATQYTQIQHEAQDTIGLYYLATPSVSIEPDNPQLDNSEYSRLNTRGYHSPHQPDFACNDTKNNETYSTIASTTSQHNNSLSAVNTELTHGALTKYVVPHISDKWYEMGLALALTPDDLEELRENHQGISEVFMLWEEQKTRPFTWDTLITTLRSINEHDLAEQLLNMRQ